MRRTAVGAEVEGRLLQGPDPPSGGRADRSAFAEGPVLPPVVDPECENDAGGHFTNRPSAASHWAFRATACAAVCCGLAARPPVSGRAASAVTGATPLAEGSVRHSGERACTPSPLVPGSLPNQVSLREGGSAPLRGGGEPVRRPAPEAVPGMGHFERRPFGARNVVAGVRGKPPARGFREAKTHLAPPHTEGTDGPRGASRESRPGQLWTMRQPRARFQNAQTVQSITRGIE